MDRDAVLELCLSFEGATENVQWGNDLVFKVGEKMFAVVGLPPYTGMSFKCAPERFEDLTSRPGVRPAPYLARAKWAYVEDLTRGHDLSWSEVRELLGESYALVRAGLPKKWRADGAPKKARPAKRHAKAKKAAPKSKRTKKRAVT